MAKYIPQYLRPKTNSDQFTANFWGYNAKTPGQTVADVSSAAFFVGNTSIGNPSFRDGDCIFVDATDGAFIASVALNLNDIILTPIAGGGSVPYATDTTPGIVTLENDIAEVTSVLKVTTPKYVYDLATVIGTFPSQKLVTGDYTLDILDNFLLVDATLSDIVITLPPVADFPVARGKKYSIVLIAKGAPYKLTVQGAPSENIINSGVIAHSFDFFSVFSVLHFNGQQAVPPVWIIG